jgi:hypothetical protein
MTTGSMAMLSTTVLFFLSLLWACDNQVTLDSLKHTILAATMLGVTLCWKNGHAHAPMHALI